MSNKACSRLMQVSNGLNLNLSSNKRGCFWLPDCSIFTCRRSLPSTFLLSYFEIKNFLPCLSLAYIVMFYVTVITCGLGVERFTVTMKVMMPISALISCIFIVLIVFFMLSLLSKRSLNCFTGISIVQNIQYIHLFAKEINWLIGRNSNLSLENKLLVYKAVIKPIWTYGIEL